MPGRLRMSHVEEKFNAMLLVGSQKLGAFSPALPTPVLVLVTTVSVCGFIVVNVNDGKLASVNT
jgi:hypothetical protein